MGHWSLEPIEREDAHGVPAGTFRMVACMEGTRGGLDCCAHDHGSADEALLCATARKTADQITGEVPTVTPSAAALADVAEAAHARHSGDWTKTARAVARVLGHSLAALTLLLFGSATAPACSAARETPVDLSASPARAVARVLGHSLAALTLLLFGSATAPACSAARETPVDLSASLPARATCTPRAWRCNDRVPEVCGVSRDGVTRWYPSTQPASVDGRPAQCAVCVVERTAHCADVRFVDAGADASGVADASDAEPR